MPGTLPDNQATLDDIETPTDQSGGDGASAVVVVHKPTRNELADTVSSCLAHATQLVGDGVDAGARASIASKIKTGDIGVSSRARVLGDTDCAIAIDTDGRREHVANAVNVASNEGLDHVVVDNLATIGESIDEIRSRADRVVSAGAELHVTETATTIGSTASDAVLGVLDGLDTAGVALEREARIEDVRDWLDGRDPKVGGRAPLGFRWEEGELVTVDDFAQLRAVLDLVDVGEMSKRHAAERLGASSRTITRALSDERRGLYGLDDGGGEEEE